MKQWLPHRKGTRMIEITRRIEFCAGHRVVGHENKCKHFHGHNYVANVTVAPMDGTTLDDKGRVIDVDVVQDVIKEWIDAEWDHGMILARDDPCRSAVVDRIIGHHGAVAQLQKIAWMDAPPTAENMAIRLFQVATDLLFDYGIIVVRVEIQETPNCRAVVDDRKPFA